MRRVLSNALAMLGLGLLLVCANPPSAQAGGLKLSKLFKMSKSQELGIAEQMHTDIEKDPGLITKGKDYDLVQSIGNQLVSKNQLKEYEYKFFLVKQDEVNAFATPGGYIYVTTGLLKYMAYDKAMVAGVMAHELGHAKDRHVARAYEKQLQGVVGLGVLGIALGKENQDTVAAVGQAGTVVLLKYNRDQEEWADRFGVDLAYKAGYDAYGLMRSLQCLEQLYGSSDDVSTWLSNHPATGDRITRTKRIAFEASAKQPGYVAIPNPPKDHPLYKLYGPGATGAAKDKDNKGDIGTAEQYKKGDKQTSPVK